MLRIAPDSDLLSYIFYAKDSTWFIVIYYHISFMLRIVPDSGGLFDTYAPKLLCQYNSHLI